MRGLTRAEELERQELEAKYGRLTDAEQEAEAEKIQQYRLWQERRTAPVCGGMWE